MPNHIFEKMQRRKRRERGVREGCARGGCRGLNAAVQNVHLDQNVGNKAYDWSRWVTRPNWLISCFASWY